MTAAIGLVGTLAADPELRYSPAGKAWLRARVSVRPYAPAGSEKPPTAFYELVAFGSLAEHLAESCSKGARIVVAGRFDDERWTDRRGIERTSQRIIVDACGPDLRWATATVTEVRRTEPVRRPAARSGSDE